MGEIGIGGAAGGPFLRIDGPAAEQRALDRGGELAEDGAGAVAVLEVAPARAEVGEPAVRVVLGEIVRRVNPAAWPLASLLPE